ncbi:two-component regulator propeller domain-containing protein [Pedobacter sp. BMA]|uniref:ligand-binding sensor domain-containing protein n=1 Tax=Pedobacter sp. BMA TaxID=1663685 RepID=UPI00064AD997|nr:two-component regulator propeller domain-containing protein [Pedobacter sp. BMA]KLT63826.1 histidine kinase [Pedobacter sp. BMA]
MKNTTNAFCFLLFVMAVIFHSPASGQQKNDAQDSVYTGDLPLNTIPKGIVRTIKRDSNGNMWIASWSGVFKYDGKTFTNMTRGVSSARFFSVLEDRKGNFWFASVGSGIYYYNGKSFQNFTTKDGLASDRVTHIYEDTRGHIWFGTENGASIYDGNGFKNIKMSKATTLAQSDSVHSSAYQHTLPNDSWMHNDVNGIIEDKRGRYWIATRGYTTIYNGKTFITLANIDGKPFTNMRSIIKDKNGNIWLGGADGLWRYNGKTFTCLTRRFVGYIYEDKKGNIWTSSERADNTSTAIGNSVKGPAWALTRYDAKSLTDQILMTTEIVYKPMIFGIQEDDEGNIWFGDFDGVHRYDGTAIKDFK